MIEKLELASAPFGEECAQVGSPDYAVAGRKECTAYKNQLFRMLATNGHTKETLPASFSLYTKGSSHDFGTYYEVVVKYDANDERSCDLAYWLEGNGPEFWDDAAKEELGLCRSFAAVSCCV